MGITWSYSPIQPVAGGAGANIGSTLTATVGLRHFGSAPLIEDDTQRFDPATLSNADICWISGSLQLSADLFNLFDVDAATSPISTHRGLPGEAEQGMENRHIHPVEPRQIRFTVRYSF